MHVQTQHYSLVIGQICKLLYIQTLKLFGSVCAFTLLISEGITLKWGRRWRRNNVDEGHGIPCVFQQFNISKEKYQFYSWKHSTGYKVSLWVLLGVLLQISLFAQRLTVLFTFLRHILLILIITQKNCDLKTKQTYKFYKLFNLILVGTWILPLIGIICQQILGWKKLNRSIWPVRFVSQIWGEKAELNRSVDELVALLTAQSVLSPNFYKSIQSDIKHWGLASLHKMFN